MRWIYLGWSSLGLHFLPFRSSHTPWGQSLWIDTILVWLHTPNLSSNEESDIDINYRISYYRAFIGAVSIGCISEGDYLRVVGRKVFPCHLSWLLQNHHHKCSHQVTAIGLLIEFAWCIVINLNFCILRILNKKSTSNSAKLNYSQQSH